MKRRPNSTINRRNWKDTREYLDYCSAVRQCQPATIELYRVTLDHLLHWATTTPLPKAPILRPTFPQYLIDLSLSVSFTSKCLAVARAFFTWTVANLPARYPDIKPTFVESLILRKRATEVVEREFFTVEEVFAIVELPALTLIEQRDRAAVAFLFLSGMRDSAFCSLPLRAVDFDAYPPRVRQWPALGVRTKFGKAANTILLPEPARLLEIVRDWDTTARAALPDTAPWFALMDPDGANLAANQTPGANRSFARRLRTLCERANISPKSPHKLRNGHIIFALKQCRDIADLKAVSQNVMHDSIKTTEAIYGKLNEADIAARLSNLGGSLTSSLFQPQPVTKQESGRYLIS